jgi:hypothetical protein
MQLDGCYLVAPRLQRQPPPCSKPPLPSPPPPETKRQASPAHPDAPPTKASLVPRGASLLRPVMMARPSWCHSTCGNITYATARGRVGARGIQLPLRKTAQRRRAGAPLWHHAKRQGRARGAQDRARCVVAASVMQLGRWCGRVASKSAARTTQKRQRVGFCARAGAGAHLAHANFGLQLPQRRELIGAHGALLEYAHLAIPVGLLIVCAGAGWRQQRPALLPPRGWQAHPQAATAQKRRACPAQPSMRRAAAGRPQPQLHLDWGSIWLDGSIASLFATL